MTIYHRGNLNHNEGLATNHREGLASVGKGITALATNHREGLETYGLRVALGIGLGLLCLAIGVTTLRTTHPESQTRIPESNAAVLGKYNFYVCTSRL